MVQAHRHARGGLMVQVPAEAVPTVAKRRSGKLEAVEVDRDVLVRNTLRCPSCGRQPGKRCDYGVAATKKAFNGTVPVHPIAYPVHFSRYLAGIDAGLVPPLPAMTTLRKLEDMR